MVAAMVAVATEPLQVTVADSAALPAAALLLVGCMGLADFTAKAREARDSEAQDFAAPDFTTLGSLMADIVVVPIFIPAFASQPAPIVFAATAPAGTASAAIAIGSATGDSETSASATVSVSTAVGSGGPGGVPGTIPGGIRGGGIHILPMMRTGRVKFRPPTR